MGQLYRFAPLGVIGALALGPVALTAAVEPASAASDALAKYGPSTVHVPFSRLYGFSVSCAALPCRIALTARATAGGRPAPGLDIPTGAVAVMNEQPGEDLYAVWFTSSELKRTLLDNTLKRYGAVALHVTGTLTDATGKRVVATRTITLLPAKPKPKPHKPSPPKPSPPPTMTQRAQSAVVNELKRTYEIGSDDEYVHCNGTTTSRYICSWSGFTVTAEGNFMSLSGEYSYCESPRGTAVVNFHSDGTEVTISFSGRYQLCNYPY